MLGLVLLHVILTCKSLALIGETVIFAKLSLVLKSTLLALTLTLTVKLSVIIGITVKLRDLISPTLRFPIYQLLPVKFKSVLVGLIKPGGIFISTLTPAALIKPIFSTTTV